MPVTLETIAERVGVSKWTVSRVLRGRAKESWGSMARRADEIRRVAREMGYRPNAAAKAVSEGRFGNVGLLLSTQQRTSRLTSGMLNAMHDALAAHETKLTVARVADEKLTDPDYLSDVLRSLSVDGLLINYTHHMPKQMIELVRQYRLPSIWVNVKRSTDAVHPNDLKAGKLAAQLLLDQGHRYTAFVSVTDPWSPERERHYSLVDRLRGYEQTMKAAKGKPSVSMLTAMIRFGRGIRNEDKCVEVMTDWLARRGPISGAVCHSEWALTSLLLAAARAGVRVPEDVSIVYIASDVARVGVPVATVRFDEGEMGRMAVEMLMEKIASPSRKLKARRVEFAVSEGGTLAPPPR
ncbi:MAG: LacI family DNA-binding transcriptional regulator [Kiritimatiellae bacterium]|nr:LacI family DNA-binding transcriptional regulator [Kiritimatiellia bacterium]